MLTKVNQSSPKELVFLNPVGGELSGGGEMMAGEVLAGLSARGWNIKLVTPSDSGLCRIPGIHGKMQVIPVDLNAAGQSKMANGKALWKLAQLSRSNPDVVWYGNTYRSLKWLALAKLVGDVRTVCHLHESHYEPYYWGRTRHLAALTDSFICISETVRRELLAGTQSRNLRAKVIYNGIQAANSGEKTWAETKQGRLELGLPPQPLICLVGRSDPLKGHDIFLHAAAKLAWQMPDLRFLIVGGHWDQTGRNPFESEIQALCRELKLETKVIFLPHQERVRNIMRCADVLVIPSRSEGFGLVAVEAMMERTPVIASDVGGLGEIIRAGVDGLLIQPGRPELLAEAIREVLLNDVLRQQLVDQAWLRAMQNFSSRAMVDAIEQELLAVARLR